ncbi:branched-chain amino acid ABC transporter permease [Jhaorihella thermophila]
MSREAVLNLILAAGFLVFPLWAWMAEEPFLITLATRAAIFAIAGVGLNIALGYGGLVSLGHAAFFSASAVTRWGFSPVTRRLTRRCSSGRSWSRARNPCRVIWIVAMLASALAALAIGALSLRTSGAYFIMITLAFAQMLYYFAISWPAYGGEDGLPIYVRNGFPGLNTLDPIQFFALVYALMLATIAVAALVRRAPFGLALNAARQAPERVRAVGISPYRLRLAAFAISGTITGLAGALFCRSQPLRQPRHVQLADLGRDHGVRDPWRHGAALWPRGGGGAVHRAGTSSGGVSDYWHVFLGALLLLVVLFGRNGVVGILAGQEARRG